MAKPLTDIREEDILNTFEIALAVKPSLYGPTLSAFATKHEVPNDAALEQHILEVQKRHYRLK